MWIALLLLFLVQRHHALEEDHKLLMLSWIQDQIPSSSSSIATADSTTNNAGMLLLNDRYLLERPIQLPQLPSSQSTTTNIETTIGPLELSYKIWWTNDEKPAYPMTSLNDRYSLDNRLGQGGCGEVWFARDILDNGKQYVLKRIFASRQDSGLREQYFGQLLRGEKGITRFIEAFYRTSSVSGEIELWLVFEHEGASLHSLLYETNAGGVQQRSMFWKRMRETRSAGAHMRREICKQLVATLHTLAQRNIVHRDVKPANVLIQFEEHAIKLGDFGSAVDFESYFGNLVQQQSTHIVLTRQDHSKPYEPPEFQHFPPKQVLAFAQFDPSFDAWSLGVLLLEVLLGTDRVFDLSAAQQRWMARRRRFDANVFEPLREFGLDDLERFNASVKRLDDVYHRGFYDNERDLESCGHELDFVFQLLRLDPTKRMTMDQALKHPYLNIIPVKRAATSEFVCSTCKRKFSTYDGCKTHSKARQHDGLNNKTLQCAAVATAAFSLTEIRAQLCESETLLSMGPNALNASEELWCGSRGKKLYSEDFFLASPNRRVFAVADGHLGDTAARFVTAQLVQRASAVGIESLPKLFAQVNQDFLSTYPQDKSGAAVTLAVLQDEQIIVANVGDVRALVCGNLAPPHVLTVDHMAATERQRIEALPGGFVSFRNGRSRVQGVLALSRSFGDRDFQPFVIVEPHVQVFNLTSSASFLVLASDGLTDAMSDVDICKIGHQEFVRDSGSLEVMTDHQEEEDELPWYTRASTRMVYEARMRDLTPDNVGVAVIPLVK